MEKEIKKFMRRSVLFLVMFLILFFLLNQFYINNVEDKKFIYQTELEWQDYLKTLPNGTLEYAFFGDSHTVYAANPEYIPNSFNFARGSEVYAETYFRVRKMLEEDDVKINNFVLEVDMITFANKDRTYKNLFYELRYFSRFMSYEELSDLRGESRMETYIMSKVPSLGGGKYLLKYFLGVQGLTPSQNGWVNLTGNFALIEDPQRDVYDQIHFDLSSINHENLGYFLKIIELAEENDIAIILMKYPHSIEYDREIKRRNISREGYYEEVFGIINQTTTDYEVLDYYEYFFNNTEFFSDGSHVNYIGSTNISESFVGDLGIEVGPVVVLDVVKTEKDSDIIYLN